MNALLLALALATQFAPTPQEAPDFIGPLVRVNMQNFETTGSTSQVFVRDTASANGGAWAAPTVFSGGTLTSALLLNATTTVCGTAIPLAWSGDTNTGLVRTAADTFALCANSLPILAISETAASEMKLVHATTSSATFTITNTTASAAAQSRIVFNHDSSAGKHAIIGYNNTSFTTSGNAKADQMFITSAGGSGGAQNGILIYTDEGGAPVVVGASNSDSAGASAAGERLRIDGFGVIVNGGNQTLDAFRVSGSTGNTNLLVVDGSQAEVRINAAASGSDIATFVVDNLAKASKILVARDNGTPVFTIEDGGALTGTQNWTTTGYVATKVAAAAPTAGDCDAAGEAGRLYVDSSATTKLYACNGTAWKSVGIANVGDGWDGGEPFGENFEARAALILAALALFLVAFTRRVPR